MMMDWFDLQMFHLFCFPGEHKILKFISNSTGSNLIVLTWERYQPQGYSGLISFEVYYKEA